MKKIKSQWFSIFVTRNMYQPFSFEQICYLFKHYKDNGSNFDQTKIHGKT